MTGSGSVLVTGATGFVGSAVVCRLLRTANITVKVLVRRPGLVFPQGVGVIEADRQEGFFSAKRSPGIKTIIHCAARVHVMDDSSLNPLDEFRKVNVDQTLILARQAANAGVRRFIFLSSVKVNGELTEPGKPFAADDTPAPSDPYGVSKMEAERGLLKLASETGMEVVIIRPVLVYGPGVKANFLSMMKWLQKGVPLPFGSVANSRSLVALDNLVDLIVTCIEHPAAANQIFMVSDGEDVSTTDLLARMGKALNKKARLLPIPSVFLMWMANLLGRKAMMGRLCGSLEVDIAKTKALLGWSPPHSLDSALAKTAHDFNRSLP